MNSYFLLLDIEVWHRIWTGFQTDLPEDPLFLEGRDCGPCFLLPFVDFINIVKVDSILESVHFDRDVLFCHWSQQLCASIDIL